MVKAGFKPKQPGWTVHTLSHDMISQLCNGILLLWFLEASKGRKNVCKVFLAYSKIHQHHKSYEGISDEHLLGPVLCWRLKDTQEKQSSSPSPNLATKVVRGKTQNQERKHVSSAYSYCLIKLPMASPHYSPSAFFRYITVERKDRGHFFTNYWGKGLCGFFY